MKREHKMKSTVHDLDSEGSLSSSLVIPHSLLDSPLESFARCKIICPWVMSGYYNILLVKNAAFHLSPFLIWTLLYFQIRSNLLKYFVFLSLLITSLIRGNGVLFFIVMEHFGPNIFIFLLSIFLFFFF